MSSDPSQARYIRKKHANEGVDEQEQQEQRQFGQNLQKALDAYGQKNRKRNIEDQVQYFGHVIEPFNMREEEGMGDIDEDGFFVFKKKNQYKDAWLQSIQEDDDQMLADKVKKKVKTQGAWRGVYDEPKKQNQAQQQIDQGEQKDEQSQDNDDQPFGKDQQQQQEQPQEMNPFSPKQIKQLICQLLPMNKSANNYLKQLKKKIKDPQTKQLHDKILQLCNLYIEKTNEYDILTSKREQLQIQADEEQSDQKEVNWDQDEDEQKVQSRGRDNKVNSKNTQAKYNDQMCHDDAQIRMEQLPKDNNNSNKNGPNRVQSNKKQKNGQNQYSDDDIF